MAVRQNINTHVCCTRLVHNCNVCSHCDTNADSDARRTLYWDMFLYAIVWWECDDTKKQLIYSYFKI